MYERFEHHGLRWIDLESPSRDEVAKISQEFGIEDVVAEELLLPSVRPHAEVYERYLYVVLHFPALRHTHHTLEQEIDFIIGRDFIITTHYDTIDPLHKFAKVFEVNTVLDKEILGDHAGFLFFYLLKKLYRSVEHELEHVRKDLAKIEHDIFSGHEIQMVEAISKSSRDLLNLRQTIEPHRDILIALENDGVHFFGKEFQPYLRALSNEYYRVHNHVMRNTDSLHELRETNNSLLSTKQNEIMKRFSILAFLTFPLMLVAALFTIPARGTPVIDSPYGFWVIAGAMATAILIMFSYFKTKKWL